MMLPIALETSAGPTPYFVGGTVLVILFLLMIALLAFGKGRDHS